MSYPIDYCGEGGLDAVLARRLINQVGGIAGRDYIDRAGPRGKQALDRRIHGFLIAARHGARMLVLRDLDEDAPCAGMLLDRLLPERHPRLCVRVVVKSAESWLLADRKGIAEALRVPLGRVPSSPEAVLSPKARLVELAGHSSDAVIRNVFAGGAQKRAAWIAEFIDERWDIRRAASTAPSLERALLRVRTLADLS